MSEGWTKMEDMGAVEAAVTGSSDMPVFAETSLIENLYSFSIWIIR